MSTALTWLHVVLGLGSVPVGLYTWHAGDATGAACVVIGMLFASSFVKPDSSIR